LGKEKNQWQMNLTGRYNKKSHYRIQMETKQKIKKNPFANGNFAKETFYIAQVFNN